jgi:riboflavin kinase/FMN adenylyltransferase
MQIVAWNELSEEESTTHPVALTIGTFDSLHIGHQRLIREVVDNGYGAPAAVCTFTENPAGVLGSRPLAGSILSLAQKIEKLEGLGVALVVLIDFSPEISTLTGKAFFQQLTRRLDIKKLVVGYDFHMGQGRDTNTQELVGILTGTGIELEIVPATMYREEVVSSSRIRRLIQQGRLSEARDMLREEYRLDLRQVVIRRQRGFYRVRRADIGQVLPRIGDYQVRFITDKLDVAGIVTIGEEQLSWQTKFAGELKEIRFL